MNIIEAVSDITEFNEISEYMKDTDLDEAMLLIIKLIAKPDVPASKAPEIITRLQAIAAKLAIMSRYYTTFEKGPEASKKKNVYYTTAEAVNKLVDALKYNARFGI
jgi:hypothetical protein